MESAPSYLELIVACREGEHQISYWLYVELDELEKKLWLEAHRTQLAMVTRRTQILSVLPKEVVIDTGTPPAGRFIFHRIDAIAQGAESVKTDSGRKVWVFRNAAVPSAARDLTNGKTSADKINF